MSLITVHVKNPSVELVEDCKNIDGLFDGIREEGEYNYLFVDFYTRYRRLSLCLESIGYDIDDDGMGNEVSEEWLRELLGI